MSDEINKFLEEYNDLSNWEISIDDLCGELAMEETERACNRLTVVSVEEVLPIIDQLKQQLESAKHDYREKLSYLASNKWTDKTAISVEMERLEKEELRDRLEYEVKMIEGAANDEINKLKQQLEEAVKVIEFYGNPEHWILKVGKDAWKKSKRARQFLAKYRGRNEHI